MIRHLVLFRFETAASPQSIAAVIAAFRALPAQIAEIEAFEDGSNLSHADLAQGFQHVFSMAFADLAALQRYLEHPAHQAFVASLAGVVAQVLVQDYEVAP